MGDPSHISLCGPLVVRLAGRCLDGELPGRQGRELFAYLVLHRGTTVPRDRLVEVLWPGDERPASPDAALSSVLARLRRTLGAGVLEGRGQLRLALEPDTSIDVEQAAAGVVAAEEALRAGASPAALDAARAALEILDRPLLPELDARWVDERRTELDELAQRALEVTARAGIARGGAALADAERAAHALVDRRPYRETGYALLMEAAVARGNVAEALRTFERLRTLLMDELGAVPSPAVRALHERLLRSGEPAPPAEPAPLPRIGAAPRTTPFVGRADQLDRLRARWREARGGRIELALLAGDAGVGKTRLAARFAEEVHAAGGRVLYGRSDEETIVAYQPFAEALRQCLAHGDGEALGPALHELARIVPDAWRRLDPGVALPRPAGESDRHRLFEAAATLLATAARAAPVLLVLDDLQWADRPTLLMLRHVLRHPEPAPLLVLGTFRDAEVARGDPLATLLADLRRERAIERVALAGLAAPEARELIAATLPAPTGERFASALHRLTAGNPFFIEEALRSLGGDASEAALERMRVPDGVSEVILGRVERLPAPVVDALAVGAVAGPTFDLDVVRELLDVPATDAIGALEPALEAGLIAEHPHEVDRFSFGHALVREAIYERLSASRRVRIHHRVAQALEGRPEGPAAEIAHHSVQARHLADPATVVRHSIAAARHAAESLAYEEAADHYRQALAAFGNQREPDEQERCALLLELARVQWRAGDGAAAATYLEAARSAQERDAPQQLARAALGLGGLGERYWQADVGDEQYRRLLEQALATLGEQDSGLRARLLGRLATNRHFRAEPDRPALDLEAVAMARRLGDADVLASTLVARHVVLLDVEHLDERLELIDEALALAAAPRGLRAEAHHWRVYGLCELGELAEAKREQACLAALAHELRQPLFEYLALAWEGVFPQLAGDLVEAERLARRARELGERAAVRDAPSIHVSKLFTIRRDQGGVESITPAIEGLVEGGFGIPAWHCALALARLERGDRDAARAGYERVLTHGLDALARDFFWLTTMALLSELCAALGDAAGAAALYERLAPHASRTVQVSFAACLGSAERQLGLLAATLGRAEACDAHFEAALARNEALAAPLLAARTRAEHAAALLRRGGEAARRRAHELAEQARDVAEARGADALRARAAALL